MVKITKAGKNVTPTKYKAVCKNCECEFTYEKNDIKWLKNFGTDFKNSLVGYSGYVECPWCEHSVFHSLDV